MGWSSVGATLVGGQVQNIATNVSLGANASTTLSFPASSVPFQTVAISATGSTGITVVGSTTGVTYAAPANTLPYMRAGMPIYLQVSSAVESGVRITAGSSGATLTSVSCSTEIIPPLQPPGTTAVLAKNVTLTSAAPVTVSFPASSVPFQTVIFSISSPGDQGVTITGQTTGIVYGSEISTRPFVLTGSPLFLQISSVAETAVRITTTDSVNVTVASVVATTEIIAPSSPPNLHIDLISAPLSIANQQSGNLVIPALPGRNWGTLIIEPQPGSGGFEVVDSRGGIRAGYKYVDACVQSGIPVVISAVPAGDTMTIYALAGRNVTIVRAAVVTDVLAQVCPPRQSSTVVTAVPLSSSSLTSILSAPLDSPTQSITLRGVVFRNDGTGPQDVVLVTTAMNTPIVSVRVNGASTLEIDLRGYQIGAGDGVSGYLSPGAGTVNISIFWEPR